MNSFPSLKTVHMMHFSPVGDTGARVADEDVLRVNMLQDRDFDSRSSHVDPTILHN